MQSRKSFSVFESEGIIGMLQNRFKIALRIAFGNSLDIDPLIFLSNNTEFGADYQSNVALPLARILKSNPLSIAQKLVENLNADHMLISIADRGFINIKLKEFYIENKLKYMLESTERLGIKNSESPIKVVLDFSSPNIAKEMHVGHLRSTIIGDCLSNVYEFFGHNVTRLNHIGDWGTQFGMLIQYLKQHVFIINDQNDEHNIQNDNENKKKKILNTNFTIQDLMLYYKNAKLLFDKDDHFQYLSKKQVTLLQNNDEINVEIWKKICEISRCEYQQVYRMLDIAIVERGESFYSPYLADLLIKLDKDGYLIENNLSKCVYCTNDKFVNLSGERLPVVLRKGDGGYLYAATDLAALQHRVQVERAHRIVYVVDSGQQLHFQMLFDVAKRVNIVPDEVKLEHVCFGLVLGEDGKRMQTRRGDNVLLMDVLKEAVRRSEELQLRRLRAETGDGSVELDEESRAIARDVAMASVKYSDLSQNRLSNYRFSYDKMLSISGNTAPYMLYAAVRIAGIGRRLGGRPSDCLSLSLVTPQERALGLAAARLPDVLLALQADLCPHKLCEYLFELSQLFNAFYESCPVAAADPAVRSSRAALCFLTADVLRLGLKLLGIQTVDRM